MNLFPVIAWLLWFGDRIEDLKVGATIALDIATVSACIGFGVCVGLSLFVRVNRPARGRQ